MKTFYDKLNEGYYYGKHTIKPQPPKLTTTTPNNEQLVDYKKKCEQYKVDLAKWKLQENNEMDARNKQFRSDLFRHYIPQEDYEEHKSVIEAIYNWAYAYGHPDGYHSIATHFEDMLDILWEIKKNYAPLRKLCAFHTHDI